MLEPADRQAHDRLWQVAAGQRGYFAADQARDAGYSYQAQRYHVRIGNWVRIDRGISGSASSPSCPAKNMITW
jgi:hypothetical protein